MTEKFFKATEKAVKKSYRAAKKARDYEMCGRYVEVAYEFAKHYGRRPCL